MTTGQELLHQRHQRITGLERHLQHLHNIMAQGRPHQHHPCTSTPRGPHHRHHPCANTPRGLPHRHHPCIRTALAHGSHRLHRRIISTASAHVLLHRHHHLRRHTINIALARVLLHRHHRFRAIRASTMVEILRHLPHHQSTAMLLSRSRRSSRTRLTTCLATDRMGRLRHTIPMSCRAKTRMPHTTIMLLYPATDLMLPIRSGRMIREHQDVTMQDQCLLISPLQGLAAT